MANGDDYEQGCSLFLSDERCEPLLNGMVDCYQETCDPEGCTREMLQEVRNQSESE